MTEGPAGKQVELPGLDTAASLPVSVFTGVYVHVVHLLGQEEGM